ncbi:unnamed protein product, partial [Adineta steineri]
KLNIGDVIYSLMDINERFVRLLFDPLYIQNLNITLMTIKSFYQRTFSIHKQVLSNICKNILPNIHDQVKQLVIEQHSIKRILTHNYSQLYSLSLVNFKEKILCKYLRDHSALRDLLTQQITHLNIDIQSDEVPILLSKISLYMFILILTLCQRLTYLNFCQLFSYRNSFLSIYKLPKICPTYSTLMELKINVETFNDCLCLVDGRFDSLSKLTINVREIKYERKQINNEIKFPKLKYFSLTSFSYTFHFDDYIIPLLRRMINLEELILFLSVIGNDSALIDGIELHNQVSVHMSHLNKFVFSINTGIRIVNNEMDVPSNQDIENSFIGKEYGQVGSCVHFEPNTPEDTTIDYDQAKGVVKSHIYSLPYQFESFLHLNSSFQGGIFPFLKNLKISNMEPQKKKQHPSTLISFPHLNLLNLIDAHNDYAEQFLVDTDIHLPSYKDDESLRDWFRSFAALSLLPLHHMLSGLQCLLRILPNYPGIQRFHDYYHNTFAPFSRFPPHMYNHYRNITPRTINYLEGRHNRMKKHVNSPHPNIYIAIDLLQKEQSLASFSRIRDDLGAPAPKRRKNNVISDQCLNKLWQRYDEGRTDIPAFLKAA